MLTKEKRRGEEKRRDTRGEEKHAVLVDEHADRDARHVEAVEEVLELGVEHRVEVAVGPLLELEHALQIRTQSN